MGLEGYGKKRRFGRTPEPPGGKGPGDRAAEERIFVVQEHRARSLHWDLRLEADGVLKSWAVPKGPSLDPAHRRLAVEVEDHPLDYAAFEGTIPEGEYGAGEVRIWDRGTCVTQGEKTIGEQLEAGMIKIVLDGERLRGGFALIRTRMGGKRTNWLLVKEKDGHARPGSDVVAEAAGRKGKK